MKKFDPWTSSFADARAAHNSLNAGLGPAGPIFQSIAATEVMSLKSAVESGDGSAILKCINRCVTHDLVAPEWLAYAFNSKYYAVTSYRAKSWDSPLSFGPPHKKGVNLAAKRKENKGIYQVWVEVNDLLQHAPATPIDKALFEKVGKKFNLGTTLTEEYFYKAILSGMHHPKDSWQFQKNPFGEEPKAGKRSQSHKDSKKRGIKKH